MSNKVKRASLPHIKYYSVMAEYRIRGEDERRYNEWIMDGILLMKDLYILKND